MNEHFPPGPERCLHWADGNFQFTVTPNSHCPRPLPDQRPLPSLWTFPERFVTPFYFHIWGISGLKWTRMGTFNSDDYYIYYCGEESLRRNWVALIINKRAKNAALGCNLRNDRMNAVFKANHSISQLSKSMPQVLMLKKLNGSKKT